MTPEIARTKSVEHARLADSSFRVGDYATFRRHIERSREFALLAARLKNDPDCRVSTHPDDCGMADAGPSLASAPNSIPDEYEMPGRQFE